ncbi:hypothetical protein [Actinoplanes sp. NPDC023714]|uniref:hypothetical protein n=1 Tax=Actinoplanes sp. NPDC023714 TaxID=3154322 RepID=UPI0033D68FF0
MRTRLGTAFAAITLVLPATVALDASPAAAAAGTELVSVGSGGAPGDADSGLDLPNGGASDDGRFILFESFATNLVPGDTNGEMDVFVRDRQAGTTERVSVATGGGQGDGMAHMSAISGDGRFVAFSSAAANLVPGDTNGVTDVFLRDRQAGTTERISLSSGGEQAGADSTHPSVSDDGNRVVFLSEATDLVDADTNTARDVFVRDRQAGTTTRVSVSSEGAQASDYSDLPQISGDGGHVSFHSAAGDLVPGDTNDAADVFVHTLQSATTVRVSVATGGAQGSGSSSSLTTMSDDGRYVGFDSQSPDLVAGDTNGAADVFVHDRQTMTTERVSVATGGTQADLDSGAASISDDGRHVAFVSPATNLVAGDTNDAVDVFVRDRQAATTERVSVTDGGGQADAGSDPAFLSGGGRVVAFSSWASNLVAADTNGLRDVFVRDADVDAGACTITGTNGADVLTGTGAGDVICGLGGNDLINARGGADTVVGGPGNDIINGATGDDDLRGGPGVDVINGGDGDDVIDGGPGVDVINGGGGDDTCTVDEADVVTGC